VLSFQAQEANRHLLLKMKEKDTIIFRLREKNKELARINTVRNRELLEGHHGLQAQEEEQRLARINTVRNWELVRINIVWNGKLVRINTVGTES